MEEDTVTVSVPYYHHEFTMSWSENREATLREFMGRALAQAVEATPFARYAGLIRSPTFGLYIPGEPELSLDARVGSMLNRGSLVLILTDVEAQQYLLQETSPPWLVDRLQTPLTVSASPLILREQLATIHALMATLSQGTQPQPIREEESDEEDDGDEEYVQPPPSQPNIARILQMMNTVPRPMPERVKKVINEETFRRVCQPVTPAEITALRVSQLPSSEVADTEDDTIGGPQDAGLGGCSVCLSLLINRSKSPGELRKMPTCGHIFHTECLQRWLTHNAITCPMCREPAVTEAKDYGYLGLGVNPETFVPAVEIRESPAHAVPTWLPEFPPRNP